MFYRKVSILAALLVLILAPSLRAQFDHLSLEQGLSQTTVLCVLQDSKGYLWFGTTDGIARHTGNNTLDNWTVYTTKDGLIDNFVQAICGDSDGHIWFGTKNGISVFDGSSWRSYTMENGLVSNNILSLARDREGVIWIGTDVGINAFRDGVFVTF